MKTKIMIVNLINNPIYLDKYELIHINKFGIKELKDFIKEFYIDNSLIEDLQIEFVKTFIADFGYLFESHLKTSKYYLSNSYLIEEFLMDDDDIYIFSDDVLYNTEYNYRIIVNIFTSDIAYIYSIIQYLQYRIDKINNININVFTFKDLYDETIEVENLALNTEKIIRNYNLKNDNEYITNKLVEFLRDLYNVNYKYVDLYEKYNQSLIDKQHNIFYYDDVIHYKLFAKYVFRNPNYMSGLSKYNNDNKNISFVFGNISSKYGIIYKTDNIDILSDDVKFIIKSFSILNNLNLPIESYLNIPANFSNIKFDKILPVKIIY